MRILLRSLVAFVLFLLSHALLSDDLVKFGGDGLETVYVENPIKSVVKRVYIQREHSGDYILGIEFDNTVTFVPRIHTLPCGMKILLSFSEKVAAPRAKRISHPILKGYFFEKFGDSSLMFIAALNMPVKFISKKYTDHSIRIRFQLLKKRVVIVDAGHGGKDPGAHGITGDYEKNITLLMAMELSNALTNSGKYRVVLTRDKDIFYPADKRVEDLKGQSADLLISLHTDSNRDTSLRGMSIYTLPPNNKELDDLLKTSILFSKTLIGYVPDCCKIKTSPCRSSELKILKVNVPAVLIELGCLSNKVDNELLHSKEFRWKIIKAIQYAMDDFFKKLDENNIKNDNAN